MISASRRRSTVLLLLLAGALWGCGGPDAPDGGQDAAPEAPSGSGTAASGIPAGGIQQWVGDIRSGLEEIRSNPTASRSRVLDLYVGRQEYIEMYYGTNGQLTGADHPELAEAVLTQESLFHELMQITGAEEVDPEAVRSKVGELEAQTERVMELAREAGVPLESHAPEGGGETDASAADDPDALLAGSGGAAAGGGEVSMPEIGAILSQLDAAEEAYRAGDSREALAGVETAYLEGFEPLESRLPGANVQRVERLIHLSLRPRIARAAPAEEVSESFAALRSELMAADRAVAGADSFWFGALNSLIIILREGLEAVLLVGALLAYLGKVEGGREHFPRIWAGVGLGIVASFATWGVAQTLIPVSGGNRELLEGITALLAVVVLIYVSNWIFQRSYIHHWKDFLKEKLDMALGTGSALAMAALAFAAVYREGFETVLFYQALLFDVGATSVLAGFVPGMILILGVGVAIIRLGLRLPLRQVFAATNVILVYLAFVFMGKGLYNLQEAGLYAPHPVAWMPDAEALRLLFGVYPVAETLAGQAFLLAVVGATYLYYRSKMKARKQEAEIAAEAAKVSPATDETAPSRSPVAEGAG